MLYSYGGGRQRIDGNKNEGKFLACVKLTIPLFYLLLFCRPLNGELTDKMCVFKLMNVLFLSAVAWNQRALNPAACQPYFCQCLPRPRHVLA
jgi:hypothetical protein